MIKHVRKMKKPSPWVWMCMEYYLLRDGFSVQGHVLQCDSPRPLSMSIKTTSALRISEAMVTASNPILREFIMVMAEFPGAVMDRPWRVLILIRVFRLKNRAKQHPSSFWQQHHLHRQFFWARCPCSRADFVKVRL